MGGALASRVSAISPSAVFCPVRHISTLAVPLITDVPNSTVLPADEDLGLSRQFTGGLFHRIWFAGQKGLVDEKVLCLQHPAVAGNQVAGGKERHIARHQLRKRYLKGLAVPQHLSAYRHRLAQSFRRLSGPVFLDEIERHADEDDGADDEEAGSVAGERRRGRWQ